MARVPQIQTQRVFSDIPQPNTDGVGAPYEFLARAFSQIAEIAKPSALQEAAARGAEAVTRDAEGRLQADTAIPVGPLSQTYNEAARATYVTEIDGDISARIAQIQDQYYNDPNGYAASVAEYRKKLIQSTPSVFKGDVGMLLTRRAGAGQSQVVTNTIRETRTRALNANAAAIDRISEKMQALAADPTPQNTAEIARLNAELGDLRTIRQGLPGSGYTPENAELDSQRLNERVLAANDTAVKSQVAVAIDTLDLGQVPDNLSEVVDLARGTDYEAELRPHILAQQASPTFASKTPAERQKVISDIQNQGPMNPDSAEIIKGLTDLDVKLREQERKDPIGFAASVGLPVPVIDPADPESYVRRAEYSRKLTEEGRNPTGELLSEQESEQLSDVVKNGDSETVVNSLIGFSSFGPDGMRKVYSEIGVDPALSVGLEQMAGGGSPKIPLSIAAGMKVTGVRTLDAGERSKAIAIVLNDFDTVVHDPTNAIRNGVLSRADFHYKNLVGNQDAEASALTYEQALRMGLGEVDGLGGIVDLKPKSYIRDNKVLLPASVPKSTAQSRYRAAVDLLDFEANTAIGPRGVRSVADLFNTKKRLTEQFKQVWSSANTKTGGYPLYMGKIPDFDTMKDAQVIGIGPDKFILNLGGTSNLEDSNNPGVAYVFSMKALTGKQ